MMIQTHAPSNTGAARGFSLIEIMVSLLIMVVAVLGLLALFDRSSKMSKVENNVTDEQQNARYAAYQVVRELRMTGAGGVPASTNFGGVVRQLGVSLNLGTTTFNDGNLSNNVPNGMYVGPASNRLHIRTGTDLLHIRGVITNAVYDLGSSSFCPPGGGPCFGGTVNPGTLVIQPCTKFPDPTAMVGSPCYPDGANDMSLYLNSTSYPTNRLFVITDELGNVGVGVVTSVIPAPGPRGITATLTISTADPYAASLNPSGIFPPGLTNPSLGGVLDDRVYFVSDGPAPVARCTTLEPVASQSPGPCHPGLMVADWGPTAPGASDPFGGDGVTVTPIADDIENLQVAYGIDFYDLNTNAGTLASPAPPEINPQSKQPYPFPSDGSISITTQAAFQNILTAAKGTTPINQDPSEDTTGVGLDEWVGNVAGEIAVGTFDWTSDLSRLRALEIALLAKGKDPDSKGQRFVSGVSHPNWIGALTWPLMDSTAVTCPTVSDPTIGNGLAYHRRAQTVRVNLRNVQFQ